MDRQRKDEVLLDVEDVTLGHITKMRWNDNSKWIFSDRLVHSPLVDDETFHAVQDLLTARGRGSCEHKPHRSKHGYVFKGAVHCGVRERRMQGQWVNRAPYYRCTFPAEYAIANKIDHPRNVYLREDAILDRVDGWLATSFSSARILQTVEAMVAAQETSEVEPRARAARAKVSEAATKMARCRAALEAGGDPQEINQWIAEIKAERLRAEAVLRRWEGRPQMTKEQITAMIDGLGDL